MDKGQTLHLFWSSFGVPAIDENSAYDKQVLEQLGISYPRITYEVAESNLGEPVQLTASIWYRNTSWQGVETKAKQIAAFIGYGGKTFPVDGGYMRIMLPQGTTIFRRMSDPDDSLRRIVINISVDYLTAT
jgi:hypothetical protein